MRHKILTGLFLGCALVAGFFLLHKKERKLTIGTSLSDNGLYPSFCLKAASDEHEFSHFKSSPVYNLILENNTFAEGKAYLTIISSKYPELLDHLEKFRSNDTLGDPKTFDFERVGAFSPTTLRYVKVVGDLKKLFGSLDGLNIVEIGGGYGGLCKVLSELYQFKSYTIVDLDPCLELSKKYLEKQNVTNVVFLKPEDAPALKGYDLIISTYAFTELDRKVQDDYLEKFVKSSKLGYFTCNFLPKYFKISPHPKWELKKILSSYGAVLQEMPEEPLTAKDNFILSWTNQKAIKH